MSDITLKDFYDYKQWLIIYLNTNEEIKTLNEAVKDKVELYEGIWWKTPLHPKIKDDWKDKAKDYIVWPTRAGYGRLWVVVVCDTKNEKIYIHSPSRAETAENQKKDLEDDLKRLLDKDGKPAKVEIDLIKGTRSLWAEEAERACVLYIINILKEISAGTYNGKINSKWNPKEAEYDRINTEFIKLKVDTHILPSLDRLDKLNGELGEKETKIKDLEKNITENEKDFEAKLKTDKEKYFKVFESLIDVFNLLNPVIDAETQQKLDDIADKFKDNNPN